MPVKLFYAESLVFSGFFGVILSEQIDALTVVGDKRAFCGLITRINR